MYTITRSAENVPELLMATGLSSRLQQGQVKVVVGLPVGYYGEQTFAFIGGRRDRFTLRQREHPPVKEVIGY